MHTHINAHAAICANIEYLHVYACPYTYIYTCIFTYTYTHTCVGFAEAFRIVMQLAGGEPTESGVQAFKAPEGISLDALLDAARRGDLDMRAMAGTGGWKAYKKLKKEERKSQA
jgi:hypothetical protein